MRSGNDDENFGTFVDAMSTAIKTEEGAQHGEPVGEEAPATLTPIIISYDLLSYETHRPSMGQVHVFSHFSYNNNRLGKREGNDYDVKAILDTFPQLGFDEPILHEDYTVNRIKAKIEEIAASDFNAYNSVVLIFMTHGNNKGMVSAADDEYEVESIWEPFLKSNPSLVGKPKIFIIQACRGSKRDIGATSESLMDETHIDAEKAGLRIPCFADMLIVYSTPQGYVSYREDKSGSWLIKHLCGCIKHVKGQLEHLDFESILVMVKHYIAYNLKTQCKDVKYHNKLQIPFISSTLTKKLYLARPSEDSCGPLTNVSNVEQKSKTSFQLSGVPRNIDADYVDGNENIAPSGNRQKRNASVAQNLKKLTSVTIELENGTKIHVSQ